MHVALEFLTGDRREQGRDHSWPLARNSPMHIRARLWFEAEGIPGLGM